MALFVRAALCLCWSLYSMVEGWCFACLSCMEGSLLQSTPIVRPQMHGIDHFEAGELHRQTCGMGQLPHLVYQQRASVHCCFAKGNVPLIRVSSKAVNVLCSDYECPDIGNCGVQEKAEAATIQSMAPTATAALMGACP